ncbi:MAG TPA: serine/threonine-protein kinase, partial [Kofleriaceae bacterium]
IGSISHPNVARFYDLVVGDPTFLVMEYVRGPTLQQVLEQNTRLECGRALDIAVRLCWGLQAVHARGIVHRDLKPANIVLGSDVEVGEQPVIIDFGLAKLATTTETELTRSGQLLGTPEYMAPEQIEGRKIDARTDVYSLGCVLYKMIAGQAPFAGDDVVQILYRQIHEKPPALAKVVPDISPAVVEVLSRALAKNPADRYPDTRDLARALVKADERRRRSTSGLSIAPVAEKRIPTALVVATAVAVGGVGGMVVARAKWARSEMKVVAKPVELRELLVVTTPAGASVEVDGKKTGEQTPAVVTGLGVGAHTIRLVAPGTATVERNITLPPSGRASLVVNLPTAQHDVIVRSMPSGATVYFDNQLAGMTPATIAVTEEDFHEVRIEKLGYAPVTQSIKPEDRDSELTLSMEIDPSPHAEVSVDSSAEAEIWIDGVNTARETPAMGLRVTPGHHTLQLKDSSGAESKKMTFESRPGETSHVVVNM